VNHVRSAVAGYHHYSSRNHFISFDSQHQEQAAVVAGEETLISANKIIGNLFKSSTVLDSYVKEEPEIFPKFLSQDQGVGTESAADRHSRFPLMDLNTNAEAASTSLTHIPVVAEAPRKNDLYWQKVPHWYNVSEKQFMEKKWQVRRHTLTRIPSLKTSPTILLITLVDRECSSR
jgi:hypothetical protein